MKKDQRPIGIFDSGLGGLTVLKTLRSFFPQENFLYVGDVARLPYGNKSPDTIRRYGEQILSFLKKQDVKMAVVACNTASTVFLQDSTFEGVPLFNVIGPGSQAAVAKTKTKRIGVIGTSTTILGHSYQKKILELDSSVTVLEKSCPLFVPLAEEGLGGDPITKLVVEKYLSDLKREHVDTLILGCTHYPLLKADIARFMGSETQLIESGEVLAGLIEENFQRHNNRGDTGKLRVCTTDVTEHFLKLAQSLMGADQVKELERIVL